MCLYLDLLPYPSVYKGNLRNGLIHDWPDECVRCDSRKCQSQDIPLNQPQSCDCGVGYMRLNDNLSIGGIRIADKGSPWLDADGCGQASMDWIQALTETGSPQAAKIDDYYNSGNNLYDSTLLPAMSSEIRQKVSFINVYKRFARQILRELCAGGDRLKPEFKQRAAIGCSILVEKLKALHLLLDPGCLIKTYNCQPLNLSAITARYVKLLSRAYASRHLSFTISREGTKLVTVNPLAAGAALFALLENAVKFSPPYARVAITLKETPEGMSFSVCSSGPEIEESELGSIFNAGYRCKSVLDNPSYPGSGYGLYIADFVASEHFDSRVGVGQKRGRDGAFSTAFFLVIPEKANILY